MWRMPELRAFDRAKSIMRDLQPKYTAGLTRLSVSSSRRLPRPPASTKAMVERVSGAAAVVILGMRFLSSRQALLARSASTLRNEREFLAGKSGYPIGPGF